MTQLERIQAEVESLSKYDFMQLKNWIEDRDFEQWDEQIAAASVSGKLDFLKREALEAKASGKLKDLYGKADIKRF